MRSNEFAEALERRRLLAGVTLLLPAYNGGIGNWIASAITGITADLGGPQNVPQYVMTIAPNSNGTLVIQSVTHVSGTATPQANNPGDILLTVDNSSIGTNPAYPPPLTAALVTNYMENSPIDGVTLADLPISMISTSIGTAMTDAIAQTFDTQGIWVNQETYMDPHPDTSAPFNDPPNTVYDNVEFADDYWRQNPDGSDTDTSPSGHPINGAYNLDLTWVENDYSTFAIAHLAPPAWYVGTIDPSLIGTSDGQGTILPDWYKNGNPPANSTGFLYTLIGGGTRPASGLWAASGGSGARTSVTHSGLQWPNVSHVDPTTSTVPSGGAVSLDYIHQDQSQSDTITFYLDTDQNPYDGTAYTLGSANGLAASPSISAAAFSASLAGVAPGTYYIFAKATDSSGLARFAYSEHSIVVTAGGSPVSGSLTGTASAAAPSYNLTALGTSDWAHWGLGASVSAFDDSAAGGTQIRNVTEVGSGGFGGYRDSSRLVSWSNGSPLASEAGDDGYIWANNGIGAGYSFTVPASTTVQTLDVYLGGYSSGSTLTAHLSDGSAPDDVVNLSGSALYTDIIPITFNAAYSGQTLTITYVKSQNINGTGGSADLIAAWLAAPATSSAPTVTANPTNTSFAAGATATFSASAGGSPPPTVQWQISTDGGATFSNISGATSTTYAFTASTAQNGDEYQAVFTNSVTSATTTPASLTVTPPATGMLSGVQAAAASSYNLTSLGTSDWTHWGRGGSSANFDHDTSGNSQISNVTAINPGGASFGGYTNTSRSVLWTNGTPTASDGGDDGYIWANNAIGAGYSFTVPADATTRTLYVYAGGYSSGGMLTAHLSNGSASDFVASASGSGIYSQFYTITFNAGAAAQTLTITYTKTTNINGTGGSVDLIAAAMAGPAAPDTTPPVGSLTSAPTLIAAGSSPYTFTVNWTDNVAVQAASVGNQNLLITGPNGYSEPATLESTGLANGPSIVATYSVPAPTGGWSNSANGSYIIALQGKQVADTSGNFALAANLGSFIVKIPVPGTGMLSGVQAAAASSYNLTSLGTSDWTHWGRGGSSANFDHDTSGNSQISNVTAINPGGASFGGYTNTSRSVLWTNGTPTASDSGDDGYIWANNAIGAGYSFTVPADATTRTLYVYAGGYSSGGMLTAHLSNASASDFVATASGSGIYSQFYAITYNAGAAGQTLTITYTKTTNINGTGGSVDLIAAAMV